MKPTVVKSCPSVHSRFNLCEADRLFKRGKVMTYTDDLLEPDEDENGQNSEGCTGDPVTCPCESCQAFRIDLEADRESEFNEGHDAA